MTTILTPLTEPAPAPPCLEITDAHSEFVGALVMLPDGRTLIGPTDRNQPRTADSHTCNPGMAGHCPELFR